MDAKRKLEHLTRRTLPLQVRHSFIRRPWYSPATTNPRFGVKPTPNTGLWTSTYLQGQDPCCDWLRFVVGEMGDWGSWINQWRYGYLYEVASDLKILEINSHEDLLCVNDAYGVIDEVSTLVALESNSPHWAHRWPDWGRLGRDFDAVHLTYDGQWDTRLPLNTEQRVFGGDNLYGWDTESTCWLRLHRRTLTYKGKIRLQYKRSTRQQLRDEAAVRKIEHARIMQGMYKYRAERVVQEFVDEHKITVTDDERKFMEERAVQLLEKEPDVH